MTYEKPLDFSNMKSDVKKAYNNGIPVIITPQMAVRWLAISQGKNVRPLKESKVAKIIADLMVGKHTARTLRFHKDGWNADGQHYLTALARSGMNSPPTFIELGYTCEEIAHFDTGDVRSLGVTSKILGVQLTDNDASLAVLLENGLMASGTKLTHEEKRELVKKYQEQVNFVRENLKTGNPKPVAMKKAIAEIYLKVKDNPEKLNRLVQFIHVYTKMDISGGSKDQAAINLVKALEKISTSDKKTREEIYNLTIVSIDNFMKRKPAKKIYMTDVQKKALKK
jgi:hypothetical protein